MFKGKQICSAVLSTAFLVSMMSTAANAAVLPEDIDIYYNNDNVSDNGETVRVKKNSSVKLTCRISPSDADEDIDVTWSSSDKDVVTVDSNGRVYAEGYGDAIIYVETENGVRDSCKIQVSQSGSTTPDDIDIYHNSYNLSDNNETVRLRKGNSIKFSYRISPSDADTDVTWRSSDKDVVTVNSDGRVYAEGYGDATIYVETENGVEDSCDITVPRTWSYDDDYYYNRYYYYDNDEDDGYYYYYDGYDGSYDYDYGTNKVYRDSNSVLSSQKDSSSSSSSSSGSSSSSKAASTTNTGTISLTERVPREVMLEGVRMGKDATYTLNNYSSVSADSLQAAAKLGNGAVRFQTMTADGKVVGALTIVPADAAGAGGNIDLGVYCGVGNTKSVQNTFDKFFANKVAVVLCDQEAFAVPVTVSANVGSMSGANLHFYTYNTTANSYDLLTIAGATKDANGFVHFSTPVGGYILISDGPLTLKSAAQTAGTGTTTTTTAASNTASTTTVNVVEVDDSSQSESTTATNSSTTVKTAYWAPNGDSYHYSSDCVTLKRSDTITSGTVQEAVNLGKSDPCNFCAKG